MNMKMALKQRITVDIKLKNKIAIVVGTGGFVIAAFIIFLIYGNLATPKIAVAAPGKDGIKSISTTNVILNEFTNLTSNAAAGSVVLNTGNAYLNSNARFPANLSTGDLVMIIQMQGAWLNKSNVNSPTWGAITSYNNAGNFEFAEVASIGSATKINLVRPLAKSYTSAGAVQVIRVPRYSTFTITGSGSLTTQSWNGSTGGVLVVEVNGNTVINGSINLDGKGFRGGIVEQNASLPGNHTIYSSTNANDGAEKGEGIAGSQANYDTIGGRYGRGAAANGGGGGNSHNASGAGGANSGNIASWDGLGNPDNLNTNWTTAWNLEAAGFASHTSSGGGRGGYAFSQFANNSLTTAPGNAVWNGDNRYNVGGLGGRPLDYSTGKIFMGGGGGAGDSNNGTGVSGANGGGLVYLISAGTVSGTGTISVNGANGGTTTGPQGWDGTGGGGGGGAVIIYSQKTISNITINAKGGTGGNQNLTGDPEAVGTGGGGGGGYISLSNSTNVTKSIAGGMQGTTNASTMINFTANGGTKGFTGNAGLPPSFPYSSGGSLPVELLRFNGKIKEGKTELSWATASEINNNFFTVERSTDGTSFREFAKVEGAGNSTSVNEYRFDDPHPVEGMNYYLLKQTGYNGSTEYFTVLALEYKTESDLVLEIESVRPNPFKEEFTMPFISDGIGECIFEMMDPNGKVIASEKIKAYLGYNDFHFTNNFKLSKGIYYARLSNNAVSTKTLKVIKQ